MAIGMGLIGLAPAVFWALSPREFDAILRGRYGNAVSLAPPSRGELIGLMQKFPDME